MRLQCADGRWVDFDHGNFLAQGGQGTVHVFDQHAHKIFFEPSQCPTRGKMEALAQIRDARVMAPIAPLIDATSKIRGYTMPLVKDAFPLCRFIPFGVRQREGITPEKVTTWVSAMADIVRNIHRAGVVVVDLNEMNVLMTESDPMVFFIDVDSYQTQHFSATALSDTVRDRHMGPKGFGEDTDWFSFAVVSSQLFMGMHPYRGRHPHLHGLDARMHAHASIFDHGVTCPSQTGPSCPMPSGLRQWYRAIFEGRTRQAPPQDLGAMTVRTSPELDQFHQLQMEVDQTYDSRVRYWGRRNENTIVVTEAYVYVNGHQVGRAPSGQIECGFSRVHDRPVLASWSSMGGLTLWDPLRDQTLAFDMSVTGLTSHRGQLYALAGHRLLGLNCVEVGSDIVIVPKTTATVRRHGTQICRGVAVQTVLGSVYFTLLEVDGVVTMHWPELDGARIIDALYESGVLWVLSYTDNQYTRWTIRVQSPVGRTHIEQEQLESPCALDGVVLDAGIVVQRTQSDCLKLTHRDPRRSEQRTVSTPAHTAEMKLFARGASLGFVRGAQVGTLRMR
ncbi:MAG: hypothetical protein VX589_07900 [Myxococcota bacterium]|nr:hypothetical protein [Myxococcota bacterium]